ncbi:HlyD family secretion protein [Vibrio barjaei]|uniref:HlyD family secretion protein n=1 Tax=Vibrio barjaei TaxID=1676683 RepID=UPI002283AB4E|nr:HlyD family secretion protein [Vibrio barjaei]MCY9874827.1 HlyD family secretion protein [Vibrio barjaei]
MNLIYLAFSLLIAVLFFFVKIDFVVNETGVLDYQKNNFKIYAPTEGLIKEVKVVEGERLESESDVVVMNAEALINEKTSLLSKIINRQRNIDLYKENFCVTSNISGVIGKIGDESCGNKEYSNNRLYKKKKNLENKVSNLEESIAYINRLLSSLESSSIIQDRIIGQMTESSAPLSNIYREKIKKIQLEERKIELRKEIVAIRGSIVGEQNKFDDEIRAEGSRALESIYRENIYLEEEKIKISRINEQISKSYVSSYSKGVVVKVNEKTKPGSFIKRGDFLLEVKSDSENEVVVYGKIDSKKRQDISIGVNVKVTSRHRTGNFTYYGVLSYISADSFYDEKNGIYLYEFKVRIDKEAEFDDRLLGTAVDVHIVNSHSTIFDFISNYLMKEQFSIGG